MRVTSNTLRSIFLTTLQAGQQRVADTQTQIATGRRINSPVDDPLAAARAAELDAAVSRLAQYQENAGLARNRLGHEEESLVGVINALQRARELLVQANNAPIGNSDRAAIALELREQLDSILSLANTVDASGSYLFAGFAESTQPFTQTNGAVIYNGDQGSRALQIGAERFVAVGDAGSEVFQRIVNGNGSFVLAASAANTGTGVLGAGTVTDPVAYNPDTYTITFLTPVDYEVRDSGGALVTAATYVPGQSLGFPGVAIEFSGDPAAADSFTVTPSTSQDLFATLTNLIAALETPRSTPADRALLNNELGQLLPDVSRAIEHLIDQRARVGSRLAAIDDESAINEGISLNLTGTLSDIRDLDYAEAISLLTQQTFALEAAQQSFARIQGLSLFRFL